MNSKRIKIVFSMLLIVCVLSSCTSTKKSCGCPSKKGMVGY